MKRSLYFKIVLAVLVLAGILNIFALSNSFCDFYTDHIYGLWVSTLGRFSAIFPFSWGQVLILAGIFLLVGAVVSGILFIPLRKKEGYRKYAKRYFKIFFAIITVEILIITLNCSILYGCSEMSFSEESAQREYTLDELEELRNMIVTKCNELAAKMPRDEHGYIVYDGDMVKESIEAMHGITDEFPRLSGYYPDPKPVYGSVYMTQAYTSGVFFPFSMEANYNDMMYVLNYPAVICHEYSHLKGYILEDESNFIGYLACINSDDLFVQYSGYSSVLGYVDDAYFYSAGPERYAAQEVWVEPQVWDDYIFLTPDNWEVVEEESPLDTETVDEVSDSFTDNSLKFFGVEDGIVSYNRVTELLLEYYYVHGYDS